jgi:thymidylate synthase
MITVVARNVNDAYPKLLKKVSELGIEELTRNGSAIAMQEPVFLELVRPRERVLFDPLRNCNPFFHVMEGIWMLAGRDDVHYVSQFNKRMATYSDDGKTFNAAYGHRWREHFGYDQISLVCNILKVNPKDRRTVISMWDGHVDLGAASLDIPCNMSITCRIVHGALDFTITNRSNDLIFGLCGANAVHMSMLQEYMATRIGVEVGSWYHLANNLHVYDMHYHLLNVSSLAPSVKYPAQMPLVRDWWVFDDEVKAFCEGDMGPFSEPFLQSVARPMVNVWTAYKADKWEDASYLCNSILSEDWKLAARSWILRAQEKKDANAQNK